MSFNILRTRSLDIKLTLSEQRIYTNTVFMISIAYYDPVDIAVINGYAPLYDLLSFSAFYRFY